MQKDECRMQKLRAAVPLRSAGFPTCRIADFPVGWAVRLCLLLLLSLCPAPARAEDFAALVQARTAIERVYYNHRLGQKPPFEQVSPPPVIERLVREDLRKEAALRKIYGVEVTPALVEAEVQRINTTTRAPEVLAEIKTALGNDPARFASVFAKPILVERLLREKFENDDSLHSPQRREVEQVRERLLQIVAADVSRRTNPPSLSERRLTSAATTELVQKLLAILKSNHSNAVSETTWQLGPRPVAKEGAAGPDELGIKQRFGPDAQIISSPQHEKERKFCFEDLPGELQRVLRVQLRQPGDVSAVIEMPRGFLVYVCKEKTAETLGVATLSLPKRGYEQWLAEQNGGGE